MSSETNIDLSMNMGRYTEEEWSDSALVNIYTEKQLLQVLVIHLLKKEIELSGFLFKICFLERLFTCHFSGKIPNVPSQKYSLAGTVSVRHGDCA